MVVAVDSSEMKKAEAEALRRIREKAEEIRQDFEDQLFANLPGNHSPADVVLLAHLITASDGYNDIRYCNVEWDKRPRSGFQTTLVYLAEPTPGLILTFCLECRCGGTARQLAIEIDRTRPAERLPAKLQRETALIAMDFRVMSFSETEVLTAPDVCRERVEAVLAEMAEQVMDEEHGRTPRSRL
jgi:hypothetical protein